MERKAKRQIQCVVLIAGFLLLFSIAQKGYLTKTENKPQMYTAKEADTKEPPTLVVAYPTAAAMFPEDQKMVEEAVKEIVRKKLGIEVKFLTNLWNYESEISSMLAGQQQIDLLFCHNNLFQEMLMNNELCQLDGLLETFGRGIIDAVGRDMIDICKVQGKLYGLPNNRDYAVGWQGYILRKDILDKYGIRKEDITSEEKLEIVFAIVKGAEPELEIVDCDNTTMLGNQYFTDNANNSPFGVHMDYGREQKLTNVFKTKEYREALERVYRWRQLGYLEKDPFKITDSIDNRMRNGTLFAYACRGKPGIEQQEKLSHNRDVVFVQFGENAVIGNAASVMPWAIPANTVSAEKSMQLLNLFYTDAEIMNLFSYGIEGVHYVKKANGQITVPEGKSTNPFIGEAWRMPNQFITYVWEGNPPTHWQNVRRINEESIHGCDYGFYFDITPVSTEYLELTSIYNKYRVILENGLVDPEEGLEQMNRELEANFIEEVIAEKQRQFERFLLK
ncbi:DUF3502 domain-containing protein [Lachnospiraceae bacterium]|nr:DUF3502 domain-containing protein [Lachnospiraceae bacterium]